MIKVIRKRDGRLDEFDVDKIANAIYKSFVATNSQYDLIMAKKLALDVYDRLEEMQTSLPTVELVQDTVEEILIENGLSRVAKAYIIYRVERTKKRNMNSNLMKTYEELYHEETKHYYPADRPLDVIYHYGIEGASHFNEMFVLSPESMQAHENHEIYINHLEFLTLSARNSHFDLCELIDQGLVKIDPMNLSDYVSVVSNLIILNEYSTYGEQLIMNFDRFMARAINTEFKRNYQYFLSTAIELSTNMTFIPNFINTVSKYELLPTLEDRDYIDDDLIRFFHNYGITDDQKIKKILKFAYNKTKGKTKNDLDHTLNRLLDALYLRDYFENGEPAISFGLDNSEAGRMFIKSIIRINQEHPEYLSKFKTILLIKDGCNDDLLDMIADHPQGYIIQNVNVSDDIFHGDATRYSLHGAGNIGKVTVNLSHIALESNQDLGVFFNNLGRAIDLSKEVLMAKYRILCNKDIDSFGSMMKNGFFANGITSSSTKDLLDLGTIGIDFVGLSECVNCLDAGNLELETEIVKFMSERINNDMNPKMCFGACYEKSIAEGLAEADMKKYGIIEGVTDTSYSITTALNHIYSIEDIAKVVKIAPLLRNGLKLFVEGEQIDLKKLIKEMTKYNLCIAGII